MALENVLVYRIVTGDSTYPHSGNFTIAVAGKVTIDDSNGSGDALFGDYTHTGGSDVPDQDVTASTVAGISVGNTIDVRYKYTITGSDGSSGTIHFVATNAQSNYGPLIVSQFQLNPGVTYTFQTFNTDGAVNYADLVPCFTSGTLIDTGMGARPIETLREGDLVQTRDNGLLPVAWIGRRTVRAVGRHAPVRIAPGVLGNPTATEASQNHRMLIASFEAELLFHDPEVLVAAKHLCGRPGIGLRQGGSVTYMHLLFERHEVLTADGIASESFFPGPEALGTLEAHARAEVHALFPELAAWTDGPVMSAARQCLHRHEAAVLMQAA